MLLDDEDLADVTEGHAGLDVMGGDGREMALDAAEERRLWRHSGGGGGDSKVRGGGGPWWRDLAVE